MAKRNKLLGTAGRLMVSGVIHPAEEGEHVSCLDIGYWFITDVGIGKSFEQPACLAKRRLGEGRALAACGRLFALREILFGDALERIRLAQLRSLALATRLDPRSKLFPRIVAFVASEFQGNIGVKAHAQHLFAALPSIPKAPKLRTVWHHHERQAPTVG
jgi:hypothetical protein